jgi:hypothetical protein
VTVTVTPTLEPIGQVLTPEEYDALPENSLREFVDGVVHVMATPHVPAPAGGSEVVLRT